MSTNKLYFGQNFKYVSYDNRQERIEIFPDLMDAKAQNGLYCVEGYVRILTDNLWTGLRSNAVMLLSYYFMSIETYYHIPEGF